MGRRRRATILWATAALAAVLLVGFWLATTDDVRVWPVRNTVQYHFLRWWWTRTGIPEAGVPGSLRGTIRNARGRPIAGARVLVSRWDGTTYGATTRSDGSYAIIGVPAGSYVPVAGAPGYADEALASSSLPWPPALAALTRVRVRVRPGQETALDGALAEAHAPPVSPGTNLTLGAPTSLTCTAPIDSAARRQSVSFASAGRPSEPALLYMPIPDAAPSASPSSPLLLAVYPGPADEWECVSVPLASAGYAVVAVGPPYRFDLEPDVDEIARLLAFARAGQLPGVDGRRAALLAGSYSAVHVLRLLDRQPDVATAVVLLGPPVDLFDMRRRYEDGTFIPPFGLDQALIALGLPDRVPLRYWRYSGIYHVRQDWPPMLLVHSRDDPVVPFQLSEQFAAALASAGVPHDLHVFDHAGHYLLSEGDEAQAIYQLTLEFLDKRLRK